MRKKYEFESLQVRNDYSQVIPWVRRVSRFSPSLRVKDLLNNGVWSKPPLWLDVVEKFPPLKESQLSRKGEAGRPNPIEYDKDLLLKLVSMLCWAGILPLPGNGGCG